MGLQCGIGDMARNLACNEEEEYLQLTFEVKYLQLTFEVNYSGGCRGQRLSLRMRWPGAAAAAAATIAAHEPRR